MKADGSVFKMTLLLTLCVMLMFLLCSCCNSDPNWKTEYISIVDSWEAQKGDDVLGYEFIYLDEDDIPELVMHCNDEAWSGFDVYTFADGRAMHLDRYDFQGESEISESYPLTSNGHQGKGDSYVSKTGILFQRGGMMGSYWVNGYKLRNGRLDCFAEYFYANSTDWAENSDPISYEIKYKLNDGSIVQRNKEEDTYFENCIELADIEREYNFSYEDEISIPSYEVELLQYDEVIGCLSGKREIIVGGKDYSNSWDNLKMENVESSTTLSDRLNFENLGQYDWLLFRKLNDATNITLNEAALV